MPKKARIVGEVPLEWMSEEETRAQGQASTGKLVNESADPSRKKLNPPKTSATERVLKGFRPRRDRAAVFDMLVAEQKNISGKRGPELIDEALTLLFKHYNK